MNANVDFVIFILQGYFFILCDTSFYTLKRLLDGKQRSSSCCSDFSRVGVQTL
jgi:hypothetical protein